MKTFFENKILHLDLHGIRHPDVGIMVQDFVLSHQEELPLIVICGNSGKMIQIVNEALAKLKVDFEETRYGRIRINYLDA